MNHVWPHDHTYYESNISEMAHRLGYCDAAPLSHVFKRFRAISPREYRKSLAS